jgi:hypothetical protein
MPVTFLGGHKEGIIVVEKIIHDRPRALTATPIARCQILTDNLPAHPSHQTRGPFDAQLLSDVAAQFH